VYLFRLCFRPFPRPPTASRNAANRSKRSSPMDAPAHGVTLESPAPSPGCFRVPTGHGPILVRMPTARCSFRSHCLRAVTFALCAASGASSILCSTPAQAIGPKDRHLTNMRTGVSVEAPAGWTLSQHTGYADTVVLLLHPDGSRISIAAAATSARDATALFELNRPGLVAQGLIVSVIGSGARESFGVDLTAPSRPDKIRQLYFVRTVPAGRQALVLTLVCRASAFVARASALDFVVTRMALEDPTLPDGTGSSRTSNGPASTGGSGGQPRPTNGNRESPAQEAQKR
jgi:hypothetical protein